MDFIWKSLRKNVYIKFDLKLFDLFEKCFEATLLFKTFDYSEILLYIVQNIIHQIN